MRASPDVVSTNHSLSHLLPPSLSSLSLTHSLTSLHHEIPPLDGATHTLAELAKTQTPLVHPLLVIGGIFLCLFGQHAPLGLPLPVLTHFLAVALDNGTDFVDTLQLQQELGVRFGRVVFALDGPYEPVHAGLADRVSLGSLKAADWAGLVQRVVWS